MECSLLLHYVHQFRCGQDTMAQALTWQKFTVELSNRMQSGAKDTPQASGFFLLDVLLANLVYVSYHAVSGLL